MTQILLCHEKGNIPITSPSLVMVKPWETTCWGEVGSRGSYIRKTNQAMWVSLYWRQESLVVINGIPEADYLVKILLLPRILWIFFFIEGRFLFLIISLTSVVLWKKYSTSAPLKIKIWKFYTEKMFSLGFSLVSVINVAVKSVSLRHHMLRCGSCLSALSKFCSFSYRRKVNITP